MVRIIGLFVNKFSHKTTWPIGHSGFIWGSYWYDSETSYSTKR